MEEKKKSTMRWILEWAGQKKMDYVWSVILGMGNVIFKIIPYFLIATIVRMFLEGNKDFNTYLKNSICIAISFIVAEFCHSLSTTLSHKATFTVLSNIRKACFEKLARVPLGYVKDTSSGTFKNIMVERIDSIETTLAHIIPEFTSNLMGPVVVLIYFFTIDYRLALWSLLPIIIGFLSYFGMMIDFKPNFGKTESSYAKFTSAAKAYANSFISWMKKCSIYHALMMTITPYTLLTVLPFGAHYVENGTLTMPDFILCIILSLGIAGPLITAFSYTDDLGKIGVIVDEIVGILDQPELNRPYKSTSVPKDNSIELSDVKFGYHDKEILHGINMECKAGSVNAIVGPSGSGKSTIAKLIASLWDVNSGSIKIGSVDIKQMSLMDFNQKIAYVAQDNYLFNETVRENIRQGNPNASDEEVIEVTKKSGCYDFIMQLENGFDTIVGGAGGHLSGGERQRISIARAMLKDAPIVILDEATAYTDPENEAILQNSIAKLVEGKTLIVIAHRLSTIKGSDQIFVVNDGNVVAHGTHDQLLSSCVLYKDMWNAHISVKDTVKEGK